MEYPKSVLISRTDSIGDVMLTLPLATILKKHFPEMRIGFLGRKYTEAVIAGCTAVDEFVELDNFLSSDDAGQKWQAMVHVFPRREIAWKARNAGIRWRIGTTNRAYHWLTCNKLVKLSRRHSSLHEAQLNAALLRPFGIVAQRGKETFGNLYSFVAKPLPDHLRQLLAPGKRHVILHPKSQGSAREWGLDNFAALAQMLPQERFQVFVSGTAAERKLMDDLFEKLPAGLVTDITGVMTLEEFISFIDACDALVAASTGPLHIAAALGKLAIGLYPAIRPMHAGRWGPLGPRAVALSLEKECVACVDAPEACHCIRSVSVAEVAGIVDKRP